MINKLAIEIHETAKEKGFFEKKRNTAEILCLIHSEVSEALEADRKSKYARYGTDRADQQGTDASFMQEYEDSVKHTFEEELADVIIRVLDLCAYKGIDIESHIKAKMRYNKLMPYKNNKKY